jgi:hypothetical protein
MIINIEQAEAIIQFGFHKKRNPTQTKLIRQLMEAVKIKREEIQRFIVIVDLLTKQHQSYSASMEDLISRLDHREADLDDKLSKVELKKNQLEKQQLKMLTTLKEKQELAVAQRNIKCKYEKRYYRFQRVPILSRSCQKKYIIARDKNLYAEQQVSELHHSLKQCKEQIKTILKSAADQYTEQGQLSYQRRGSIETLNGRKQTINHLLQGCDYWVGFDTHQAQVVHESAAYLLELCEKKSNTNNHEKGGELDVDQVWTKTFCLACLEYGECEVYGNGKWGSNVLEIEYNCGGCQQSCTGWPILQHNQLVCAGCKTTESNKTLIPFTPQGRMKQLFQSFFSSKTYPLY